MLNLEKKWNILWWYDFALHCKIQKNCKFILGKVNLVNFLGLRRIRAPQFADCQDRQGRSFHFIFWMGCSNHARLVFYTKVCRYHRGQFLRKSSGHFSEATVSSNHYRIAAAVIGWNSHLAKMTLWIPEELERQWHLCKILKFRGQQKILNWTKVWWQHGGGTLVEESVWGSDSVEWKCK